MQITIPKNAEVVLLCLEEQGFEAYVVGGCVRDAILGRTPGDWDITTSAKPEEIKGSFRTTIDTGIQHGTVTVLIGGEPFEVTTYRLDGEYEDGRHPKEVAFTASLAEDLRRRDFTINAMAYHPERGLVDLYDGLTDLKEKRIRCVGCAEERFGEDALRILRALRFASQLDFEIEEHTRQAIRKLAKTLEKISAERIQKELTLLLLGKSCTRIREAWEDGVTAVVLPELNAMMKTPQNNPHHCFSVGEHCIHAMEKVRLPEYPHSGELVPKRQKQDAIVLKWAMLLHDVGKTRTRVSDEHGVDHFYGHAEVGAEMAWELLHRLRFDNYTCEMVTKLIRFHDDAFRLTEHGMRRMMHRVGEDLVPLLFQVNEADIAAQNPELSEGKYQTLKSARELYQRVLEAGDALTIKDLAVKGYDLMELGIPQGKQLGHILTALLEQVLEEPSRNEREWLLSYAREAWKTGEGEE